MFEKPVEVSDGSLGWQVRLIKDANGKQVTFNDGVSFRSPCFAGAMTGDTWVVKYEPGQACFGQIRKAILLDPVGR